MRKYIFFILFLCIYCSKNKTPFSFSNNTPLDSTKYFPLKVGNTWYYDSPSSQFPGTINPGSVKMIRSSFIKNDKIYYLWTKGDLSFKDFSSYRIDTIRTDDHGNIWLLKNDIEYLWFDFTLDNGSTYTIKDIWTGFVGLGTDYFYTVYVRKNISSQLYSNSYNNCIELIFNIVDLSIGDENYYTFAPGVGLIQCGSGEQWNLQRLVRAAIY